MPSSKFAAWLAEPTSRLAIVGATGWVGRAVLAAAREAVPGLPAGRLRLFSGRGRSIATEVGSLETEIFGGDSSLGDGEWIVVNAGVIGGDERPLNDVLLHGVLALAGRARVRRLLHVSSGAAGFADDAPPAKAAYARMKRDHEDVAALWSDETGVALLIPRIFNLGGPFITYPQNYALGDFILRLMTEGRLRIGAADPVVRSYVHVMEMARTVLDMALDDGEDAAPFDISGENIVELGDLARAIAQHLGLPDAVIDRPAPTGGGGDRYVGDGRRYQAALSRAGRAPAHLDAIIADTVDDLRAPRPD